MPANLQARLPGTQAKTSAPCLAGGRLDELSLTVMVFVLRII